jgi:hypothetical protein
MPRPPSRATARSANTRHCPAAVLLATLVLLADRAHAQCGGPCVSDSISLADCVACCLEECPAGPARICIGACRSRHPADVSVRVFNSTNTSVANGVPTPLPFDSERWDTAAIHDTVMDTSKLFATTPGRYVIFGHVNFVANPVGRRQVYILWNGTYNIASVNPGLLTSRDHSCNVGASKRRRSAVPG